jgi:hypothetical protein
MRRRLNELRSRAATVGLMLLGVAAYLAVAFALESVIGLPFDTSYRIACAALCLFFIYKLGADSPAERWPRIALALALLVNVGLFFTPLVRRPASRGEIILFALPDAVIVLAALIASYPAADEHRRALLQQMILALIVVVAFCALFIGLMFIAPRTGR